MLANPLPATPTGLNELPEPKNVPPDEAVYQLNVPGSVNVIVICIKSTAASRSLVGFEFIADKTAPKPFELISVGVHDVFHKSVGPP